MLERYCNCSDCTFYYLAVLIREGMRMKLYYYDGPVLAFNKIVANRWKASTYAVSEAKARCNLAHQFKRETGREPRSNITIPGKLIVEGENMHHG